MGQIGAIVLLLIVGGIIAGIVALVRRGRRPEAGEKPSEGGDYIAYLLLALAVGAVAFALAELGQIAFPSRRFVSGDTGTIAAALAVIVVAGPISFFLWRRQAVRRAEFPRSGGWTMYLALIELTFLILFMIGAMEILEWAFQSGGRPDWTDAVIFGAVVAFHEWAGRKTPPRSEEAELPRVVASAIGLVFTALGVGGLLLWLLERGYATLEPMVVSSREPGTSAAMLLVGAPIWWYRWLRRWGEQPSASRKTWLAIASVGGLTAALGSVVYIVIETVAYLFTDTGPAGTHFDFLPTSVAAIAVGTLVWSHHTTRIGAERTKVRQAYEYAMTAIGLSAAVGSATSLATAAFGRGTLVAPSTETALASAVGLVAAMLVWWVFWSRAAKADPVEEAKAGPRRVYLLGLGVIMGLTAAGSLIATLVVLFQNLLGSSANDSIVTQASLFVFAGAATWHLLRTNAHDRDLLGPEEEIKPFQVTLVASAQGRLADYLPVQAHVTLLARGDDTGVVDDEMAEAIAADVGNQDSIVWVDEDGYRVAPAR